MTPRGLRLNNPGNLRRSQDHWVGQVWPGMDASFCQFDTMAHGIRASARVLLGYQAAKLNTVRKIVTRWAPAVENDTRAYVTDVAMRCGVVADAPITLGQGMLTRVCRAIFHHENGSAAEAISDADMDAGVRMALGISPPPSTAAFGHDATLAAITPAGDRS